MKKIIKNQNLYQPEINNNMEISKAKSIKLHKKILKDVKQDSTDNKNQNFLSLDFYALGKVHNYQKINNFLPPSNGFRSTSNNLLKRNYFSINNRYFDDLKNKNVKKQATIFEQNVEENNYLAPLNIFNSTQKYDLPSNVINQETYNIAKEKLFAKDNFSTIRKGRRLSKNDFIYQKQNLMGKSNNKLLTPNYKSINLDKIKDLKRYKSSINLNENDREKNNNNKIINEKIENKKLTHSCSTKCFSPKNPNDISKEVLKTSIVLFNKNHSKIVRDRNWWKIKK